MTTAKKTTTERTSESVASVAGRLLNGRSLVEAELWLQELVMLDGTCDDADRTHALTLLGALIAMRSLAGSALTQRG